jgi:DNA-binding response OmpR family regulator
VVILSINETWSDLIDLLNAGAMTYLTKGIDEVTLNHDLHAAIRAHRHPAIGAEPTSADGSHDGPLAPLTSALFGLIETPVIDEAPSVWSDGRPDEDAHAA